MTNRDPSWFVSVYSGLSWFVLHVHHHVDNLVAHLVGHLVDLEGSKSNPMNTTVSKLLTKVGI